MKNKSLIVLMIFLSAFCCSCSKKEKTTEVIIEEFTTEELEYVSLEYAHIGDVVSFGNYEQNLDVEGKEEILWDVLDETDDSVLLISHYILDVCRFNDEYNVTWKNSNLRAWINNDFYNNGFSESEKKRILITKVDNSQTDEYRNGIDDYPSYRKKDDTDTDDRLFVLSLDEVKKYYGAHIIIDEYGYKHWFSNGIKSTFTPYAAQRLYDERVKRDEQTGYYKERKNPIKVDNTDQDWWMRTESGWNTHIIMADQEGYIGVSGVLTYGGVRPAMWVKKK